MSAYITLLLSNLFSSLLFTFLILKASPMVQRERATELRKKWSGLELNTMIIFLWLPSDRK
jgi:hypothetical protein